MANDTRIFSIDAFPELELDICKACGIWVGKSLHYEVYRLSLDLEDEKSNYFTDRYYTSGVSIKILMEEWRNEYKDSYSMLTIPTDKVVLPAYISRELMEYVVERVRTLSMAVYSLRAYDAIIQSLKIYPPSEVPFNIVVSSVREDILGVDMYVCGASYHPDNSIHIKMYVYGEVIDFPKIQLPTSLIIQDKDSAWTKPYGHLISKLVGIGNRAEEYSSILTELPSFNRSLNIDVSVEQIDKAVRKLDRMKKDLLDARREMVDVERIKFNGKIC